MDLALSSSCRIPVSTDPHADGNQVCPSLPERFPKPQTRVTSTGQLHQLSQASASLYWKYNSLSSMFLSFDDIVQAGNLSAPCSSPHITINFYPAGGTANNCPCLAGKGRRQLCPVHYCTPVPAHVWAWPIRAPCA